MLLRDANYFIYAQCLLFFSDMVKVVHLIPFDGVGGVEVAARSIGSSVNGDIAFEIRYIFENIELGKNYWAIFNPFRMVIVAWRLARSDVDLLIVSLWRSSIVGLMAKLFRPKLRLITFLHLDKNVHFLDFIFTYLSTRFSIQIWADSQASLDKRISNLQISKGRIISFVTQRYKSLPEQNVDPSFVFWGRITQQKNLVQSVYLFSAVLKCRPDAKFTIIGPDAGALNVIKNLCASLGLTRSVLFTGPLSHKEIIKHAQRASFYLQTSVSEGMAMSVVEAMQFGLVPVVTAVGEISAYCRDGVNAVVVSSNEQTVASVLALLNDNDKYQEIRRCAISTWLDKPIYKDSILMTCNDVINNLNFR